MTQNITHQEKDLKITTTPTDSMYGMCMVYGKKSFRWAKEKHVLMWYKKHRCIGA